MRGGAILILCCGLGLVGCSNPNVRPVVATTGAPDANRALNDAIASVDRAMAQFDESQTPQAAPVAETEYVPVELRRPMDVHLAGISIDQAATVLAMAAGYTVVINNPKHLPQLTVSLDGARTPVVDLLRSIGDQAGKKVAIAVNGDNRSVEVTYHDAA